MPETRTEAEARYKRIRYDAYRDAQKEFRGYFGDDIYITEINEEAIRQAEAWRDRYPHTRKIHMPGWSWRKEITRFRRRPRRVEVAIWRNECFVSGMALGRTSDRRVVATIHFIEADPDESEENNLMGKIGPITIRFLEIYAAHLNCSEIAIDSPVDGLLQFYRELGFNRSIKKGEKVVRMIRKLGVEGFDHIE